MRVCMYRYSVYVQLTHKQIVVCLELTVSKAHQLVQLSQCRKKQRPSEGKQRHVAMTRDTSKVVVGMPE